LLSLVTHPIATNPNATLAAHAQAHGWPILKLFND
jgi:phosphoserine phosphatase